MKTFVKPLLLATFCMVSAPAMAQQDDLSHPTAVCIEQRTVAEVGDELVDMVLAAADLAEQPTTFEQQLAGLAMECALEHGVPDMDTDLLGSYAAARAMQEESEARLVAMGMDMNWLNAGIEAEQMSGDSVAIQVADAIYNRMALPQPDGLGVDARDGSREERTLGVLAYAYIAGRVEVARILAILAE